MNKEAREGNVLYTNSLTAAKTHVFDELFKSGMKLIEEVAVYLDGPGRQEVKKLDRRAAVAYSTVSMRLTTRLMQVASWLLLLRAVKDGEVTIESYIPQRKRIDPFNESPLSDDIRELPATLQGLIVRSNTLVHDVTHLDRVMHQPVTAAQEQEEAGHTGARGLQKLLSSQYKSADR